MKNWIFLSLLSMGIVACQSNKEVSPANTIEQHSLDLSSAQKIFELPVHCLTIEYPNKLGQTIGSADDLKTPIQLRPIFYGCFDWHSSVHGYWSIINLMKEFPELDPDGEVRKTLNEHITPENIAIEMQFFMDKNNRNFERTYGWAWLFKLQEALDNWQDDDAQKWAKTLQPLTDLLIERYEEYLPKLYYPIRSGTHDNTAFGLSLSLDYARSSGNKSFESLIIVHAKRLYNSDENCALYFEPSGHDFLSPCLEEAYLMSKVLANDAYKKWLTDFLPQIFDKDFHMIPARVSDRSDGHLVHLDGLNFSRAACLYGIATKLPELEYLNLVALEHFDASFRNISDDGYMGSHWLGTFALYALQHQP